MLTAPLFRSATSPARHFSTKGLPAREQFEAWRTLLADSIELLPTPDSDTGFPADYHSWNFGGITFTRALFSNAPARQWRHRPRSFMDHWCVVLARTSTADQPSLSLLNSSSSSLTIRSLAMPFEGRAKDSEVLTLFLPRDQCSGEMRDLDPGQDINVNPALAVLLASFMDNLALQLPLISAEHAHRLAPAVSSLVAACIVPCVDRHRAAAPVAALLADRALHIVHQMMASPEFGPEQLCRALAVSRSKLYRLFEKSGGITHFINRERLREAHRRLSDPIEMPYIHVIGTDVGFVDHSTFSRAFRREFGYSPREARERALAQKSATSAATLPLAASQIVSDLAHLDPSSR